MTFPEVRRLVALGLAKGQLIEECKELIADRSYQELPQGTLTAGDAAKIFSLRRQTTRRGGKDVPGLDDLIKALNGMPSDDKVLLFHFSGREKVFSVFLSQGAAELLGCIRVGRDSQ